MVTPELVGTVGAIMLGWRLLVLFWEWIAGLIQEHP